MTKDEGLLTPAQVKAMGASEMAEFLSRNSGDANFQWRVREAILNRAAELLRASVEPRTSHIKTWRERCDELHDDMVIVSSRMVQQRMQEEIDDLRAALNRGEKP